MNVQTPKINVGDRELGWEGKEVILFWRSAARTERNDEGMSE